MSQFYDKSSMVFLPSGYKDGKLYSQKPLSSSGELTFSRGSDIEATRVNANGYIQKAAVNLLLQSNSFSTTWTATNATLTSGQSGYDGSSDAWELDITTSGGYIQQSFTAVNGVRTVSVYAKKGTLDFLLIYARDAGSSNDAEFYFDLNNGAVGSVVGAAGITLKITDIGGGWYRCEGASSGGFDQFRIYGVSGDGSATGTGSIYIQDAQLNYGLVAQEYQETTTTSVVTGITNDMPRLDYSGGATCPSLLLEGSRQNLVEFSEYLNGSIWVQNGSSVTDNDATSPEGLNNAAKVEGDGSADDIRLYDNFTFPSTGNYTLSVFAKAGNNDFLRLVFGGVTNGQEAYFDLVNGTTEETWASIEAIGTDGWYRCSITSDLVGPDLTGNYNSYVSYSYTNRTFPSAGDANGQYIYLYGFQLEQNATKASSYIPTYGTSATRLKDACYNLSASSLIGTTEGVIFIDIQTPSTIGSNSTFSIGGGSSTEYAQLEIRTDLSINWRYRVGGTDYINANVGSFTAGDRLKIAFAYKNLDSILYLNGSSIATDTGTTATNAWDEVRFSNYAGTANLEASINQTLLFKTRLSNADLATLTA